MALAYGALLRAWLVVHLPLFGDEAVVGLMARSIDHGHFSAFYWGQLYGGLEPYVAALLLPLGGGGATALNSTPALLAAVAAVLVGVIVATAGRDRLVAVAAGCVAWVWPYAVVWNSVRELGFRFAALCCGLALLACGVRAARGNAGVVTFAVLGVALGLGWWASPEIVYFAVPAALLVVAWWRAAERSGRAVPVLVAALGALAGSLPWWYANLHSGFASLRRGAQPDNGGMTYGAKLSAFFREMLPRQLGVKTVPGGSWVGGPTIGRAVLAVVLLVIVAAVARAVWRFATERDAVPLALAAGVVAFPFLYAAAPGTGYWVDGRYGVYLPALVVALLGAVLVGPAGGADWVDGVHPVDRVHRRGRLRARAVGALGVLGATCLTVGAAHASGIPASPGFFRGWTNADASMQQAVDGLRAHHITAAYGDYWTAYDLDFLDRGDPPVSPSVLDVTRSRAIAAAVASSPDPAWLFFAPGRVSAAAAQFANPQPGPGPYTEQSFEARLRQLGIPYEVVHLGVLDAVVPSRRVVTP